MSLPRMRTTQQAFEEIKALDPSTALSRNYIRCLIKREEVPTVRIGRRILVNLDELIKYLENPASIENEPEYGKVRPVKG